MKWEKLICAERQQAKEEKPKQFEQFDIDAFDDDFLSIISSQAFRRLQDKTQVFPLDKSDFVRTRLTHSMEVSAIARDLARMITQNHLALCKGAKLMNGKVLKSSVGHQELAAWVEGLGL